MKPTGLTVHVIYYSDCNPNGKLPSELLYRQFRGIMPTFNDSSACVSGTNHLSERRKEEKEKFDARHQCQLKPLVIGSTVSFLNSDLKTWSVGRIHGRSSDNSSYGILTENGLSQGTGCTCIRLVLCLGNVFPLIFLLQIPSTMHANLNLSWLLSHHQFSAIRLQLLLLMLKLSKASLVPMIVIEAGQAE